MGKYLSKEVILFFYYKSTHIFNSVNLFIMKIINPYMETQTISPTEEEYIVLRKKLNLQDGLNGHNSTILLLACRAYNLDSGGNRVVTVKNLSDKSTYDVEINSSGSIMGLMALSASKGSLLEIRIDGIDEAARNFCEDLKKGLDQEHYFIDYIVKRNKPLRNRDW